MPLGREMTLAKGTVTGMNGTGLRPFHMRNRLIILALIDISANAKNKKYKTNAPRISPANPASKTPLSPS